MRKSFNLSLKLTLILAMVLSVFSIGSAQDEDMQELNLIYWQAPSSMNPYLSGGTKEIEAASVVLEPLARYDETGALTPWLVDEIPTVENGGVVNTEDSTTVTWTISEGITWSDGTPLTAEDAVFTWSYCTNEATGCAQIQKYEDVADVVAVDESTVEVVFDVFKPFPYGPFVGAQAPLIQAAQFADCVGASAQECTEQNFNPIGTGAYVVEDFRANDVITFVANENYREEDKPYFDRVTLKGGGDAESAARSVLETGEFDYAWNLQIAPQILGQMEEAGMGTVVVAFGTSVERLMVNQTNPSAELGDDMRSVYMDGENAHPFLTNDTVWQALSMVIDRQTIAEQLYGAAGQATCNVLPAPAIYASDNNADCITPTAEIDAAIEEANAMLDEAGIVDSDGDGIRELDGVPLSILYQTSTNAVRQSTQAIIKQAWDQLGVETELRNIDASVFFGGDVASPDTYGKFYADIEMYTNNFDGTDPEAYLSNWSCANVSGPENNFLGPNVARWCNPDYDALVAEMASTSELEDRAELAIQMNDLIVQSGALIPVVHRGDVSAHANTIEGVRMNSWDSELWNIADWTRTEME